MSTAGPWEISVETKTRYEPFTGERQDRYYSWIKSGSDFIALMHMDRQFPPGADALLIAAAPELLTVLQTIRASAGEVITDEMKREIDRVIEKAEGKKL